MPGSKLALAEGRPGRVLFVDLARALAVLFMIQGHTLHVLLGETYQANIAFDAWLFLRGLTSCTFLTLSGMAFSIATVRRWDALARIGPKFWQRIRRFAVFVLLGYVMHFPVRPISGLESLTLDQWRSFTAFDILQLVWVTLAGLQVLVLASRTPRRLALLSGSLGAAVVLLTPLFWGLGPGHSWQTPLVAFVSASSGSLFPLFPWAGYLLFGAAIGAWFGEGLQSRADTPVPRIFFRAGGALLIAGVAMHLVPWSPYVAVDFWKTSPNLFLVRTGSVLLALSVVSYAARGLTRLPFVVRALSQESLLIYLVHVCILYGSIWNTGLMQVIGPHLGPLPTLGWIVALFAAMSALAAGWHHSKRAAPWGLHTAMRACIATVLFYVVA